MTAKLSLGFVKFTVSDLPAKQAFYEQAFGLTEQKRLEFPGFTEVILQGPSGADLALIHYTDGRELVLGNATGPIGCYLEDVDGAYERALAAGGQPRIPPTSQGDIRVAFVVDPEGHEIEFLRVDD